MADELRDTWEGAVKWVRGAGGISIALGTVLLAVALLPNQAQQVAAGSPAPTKIEIVTNDDGCSAKDTDCHPIKKQTTTDETIIAPIPSTLPALGVLLILVGLPICFPTMLRDGTSTSAMRVAFYALMSVFMILIVKAGWNATSISDIKVDPSWAALLSSALVAKSAQSFSENRSA
jgi:hypothetical protein